MITSRDVAVAAGVSQATVSRALSGSARVSPQVLSRVSEAAERLGYEPNVAARAMRTQRSGSVGVVVDRITNPFYPEMIEALSRRLVAANLRMLVWDSIAGERDAIQAIRQRLVDGLIFATATPSSGPLAAALSARAPVVLVNRIVEGSQCDQVDTDNAAMSWAIAEYVASAGHSRVGFITASEDASTAWARRSGFLEGAKAHGLRVPGGRIVDGAFSHDGGYLALQKLFRAKQPPTAVFCANDVSALGAMDAARAMGVRVPADLWIIGFDDIEMASWEAFDLTTVRQPMNDMVNVAVELLLDRIDNPAKPFTHHRFHSELVVRGSTGRVPFQEPNSLMRIPNKLRVTVA